MRRLTSIIPPGRRRVVLAAAACLCLTALVVGVTSRDDLGSVVFIPWVAVLAFELGATAGAAVAAVALALFLVPAVLQGTDLSAVYIAARVMSFQLIGVGVGLAGTRLREGERTTRTLVEGLPLVTYVESAERLTYIGPQIESLTGYPAGEWLRDRDLWREQLHPDDAAQVIAAYEEAKAASAPLQIEYRLRTQDGGFVWVDDRSTPIEQRGQPSRQGFIVDVTAQKLADEQRERSGALMRGLVDSTVDGISLTDRNGEIVIANAPMRRLVADLRIPTVGPIHERLIAIAERARDPERFARRIRELADDPDTASVDEFELSDKRVFQGFTAPVVGADGEFLGRIWTLRDLTEQRELDRLREAFVGNVSHELRTPLTSISGYVELLQTGPEPLTAEQIAFVEVIQRNTGRLQEIVNDLLFVAQLDAGRLSLEHAEADLSELAHQAVEPAADATVVRVTDSGMGIPRDEQARLFERFFRSASASSGRIPGTGLGLSITRAIVEGHDGSISVESEEGSGTTFAVSLPNRR